MAQTNGLGQIIILNGVPRSGKSSIVAVIQETFDGPWMNLGVGTFKEHIAPKRYSPAIGLRPGGERPDLESLIAVFYAAMYESIAAHSRLGLNVAVDVGHHDSYSTPQGILANSVRRLHGLPEKVAGLVAGVAGVDPLKKDITWAEDFTAVPGLTCERYHVNDAVVAHAGAFHFSPGIVAIAGTGSIVWGITETGRHIRDYDFGHQSGVSAYWLGSNTVFRLLTSEIPVAEAGFVERILQHLGVKDITELRQLAAHNAWQDHGRYLQEYSNIAPLVTEAALEGVPLACSVCDTGIAELATGIRLVGNMFASHSISCALVGGVADSAYVRNGLMKVLTQNAGRRYKFIEPRLSPAAGAVLLALQRHNVLVDDMILETLSEHPRAAIA